MVLPGRSGGGIGILGDPGIIGGGGGGPLVPGIGGGGGPPAEGGGGGGGGPTLGGGKGGSKIVRGVMLFPVSSSRIRDSRETCRWRNSSSRWDAA